MEEEDELTVEQLDELIQLEQDISTNNEASSSNDLDHGNQELHNVAETSSSTPVQLTPTQKAQIERNRQKALLLKQARENAKPYNIKKRSTGNALKDKIAEERFIRHQGHKYIDTGGGFLLDVDELEKQESQKLKLAVVPAPIVEPDRPDCLECKEPFAESYLLEKFDYAVCDKCRDNEDKHSLITKTDAMKEYLLRDYDFDKREPILKFIVRKNPHNSRWGDMKLYLQIQVEKRALEIWESEEKLEEEKEKREENREKAKAKKYNKQVKALRMGMRSSLYKKSTTGHKHVYGDDESYNEDDDTYSRTCTECGFVETYEKM